MRNLRNYAFFRNLIYPVFVKILFLIIVLFAIIKSNVVFCGTVADTPIATLQEVATRAVLDMMNDDELDAFARHINFPVTGVVEGWRTVDYYYGYDNNHSRSSAINYQALFYWLLGTAALFVIVRWGSDIKDFIFSLPYRAVDAAPDLYHGAAAFMRTLGRAAMYRQEVLDFALHHQNVDLVRDALDVYLRSRGMQA